MSKKNKKPKLYGLVLESNSGEIRVLLLEAFNDEKAEERAVTICQQQNELNGYNDVLDADSLMAVTDLYQISPRFFTEGSFMMYMN